MKNYFFSVNCFKVEFMNKINISITSKSSNINHHGAEFGAPSSEDGLGQSI